MSQYVVVEQEFDDTDEHMIGPFDTEGAAMSYGYKWFGREGRWQVARLDAPRKRTDEDEVDS